MNVQVSFPLVMRWKKAAIPVCFEESHVLAPAFFISLLGAIGGRLPSYQAHPYKTISRGVVNSE